MLILRLIFLVLALLLILFGIVAMIAPTPLGFVIVLAGFFLLAIVAPGLVRRLRKRWRKLDWALDRTAEKLPEKLRDELQKSDPPDEGEEDDDEEDEQSRSERYDG